MLDILDSFEIDESVHIVTKYESGGDLLDYLEACGQEYLHEAQALQIFL